MIRHKEAMPGEKSKLNRQSQSCRLRFAGHERDVRKTQAPGADQIPTRNAKAHNAAPLSERNVVPRMGDRQQQPARSRRVLQDDQNRSFGTTGPPCATAHRYGGRGTTGKHARARSEEQTSEIQSLIRISYAVFCLQKNKPISHTQSSIITQ